MMFSLKDDNMIMNYVSLDYHVNIDSLTLFPSSNNAAARLYLAVDCEACDVCDNVEDPLLGLSSFFAVIEDKFVEDEILILPVVQFVVASAQLSVELGDGHCHLFTTHPI